MDRVTGVNRAGCALAVLALFGLAGCEEGGSFGFAKPAAREAGGANRSVRLVERDVEAPQVFQKTDMGLWDGRPSLGGVWVAHPDVTDPERVIIRNTANGTFVIGALFRRERDMPGPAFQVSSDAAVTLEMLAGAPAQLNVTALRREEAAVEEEPAEVGEIAAPAEIEASMLDPVAGAAAAIEAAEIRAAEAPPPPPAAAEPVPASAPERPATTLDKPFIQVGIFSIEQNARNTATALRQAGMVPTVLAQNSQGKAFWRVVVGPATTADDRGAVLKKIKGIGFADAYPVTN
ncbi:SPOR domain-containing protein [Roseovarius autotrophicus]|uniref:SPOR domain-containing protein n=1 Tax=Roseovarius autotrophicus TaxID=2824121 RepID=UPI0019FE2E55|nr:SPOR domain-containing protein [Roseovarius autotrophicus]MBE0454046.1 SPOR domain-containing protein [Roseovarius sp.]